MLTKSDAIRLGFQNDLKILVGIGTNLSDASGRTPIEIAENAVRSLHEIGSLRVAAVSRWYGSAPTPPSDQMNYVNGAALLVGNVNRHRLLASLQAIEQAAGRQRSVPNAARTLDLDIIDFGGQVSRDASLELPHPRAHLRAFVLLPVADICSDWVHPALRRSVHELIAELPKQDIWAL